MFGMTRRESVAWSEQCCSEQAVSFRAKRGISEPFIVLFRCIMKKRYLLILISFTLTACSSPLPPKHPDNICKIFKEYPSWYWDAERSRKKWGTPVSVQMAFIREESAFRAEAEPARQKLFGVIPWFRPTTASGYTQALDVTWRRYIKSEGRLSGGRNDFSDATDFIGWYTNKIHYNLGISRANAKDLYLAYHEGVDGYREKSYLAKPWLVHVADKVQGYATLYRLQLVRCQKQLPREPWWYRF